MLFGDLSRMRVRAEVEERFVQKLAAGQAVAISGRNLAGQTYLSRVVCREQMMGDKAVFTWAFLERKDLAVLQVLIDMGPPCRGRSGRTPPIV